MSLNATLTAATSAVSTHTPVRPARRRRHQTVRPSAKNVSIARDILKAVNVTLQKHKDKPKPAVIKTMQLWVEDALFYLQVERRRA